jgi:hypothetical protein
MSTTEAQNYIISHITSAGVGTEVFNQGCVDAIKEYFVTAACEKYSLIFVKGKTQTPNFVCQKAVADVVFLMLNALVKYEFNEDMKEFKSILSDEKTPPLVMAAVALVHNGLEMRSFESKKPRPDDDVEVMGRDYTLGCLDVLADAFKKGETDVPIDRFAVLMPLQMIKMIITDVARYIAIHSAPHNGKKVPKTSKITLDLFHNSALSVCILGDIAWEMDIYYDYAKSCRDIKTSMCADAAASKAKISDDAKAAKAAAKG